MALQLVGVTLGVGAVSALATAALIRFQRFVRVFDIPNSRSSHSAPRPRTGGLAIALAMACGAVAWRALGVGSLGLTPEVAAAAAGFFLLGLSDDLWKLPEVVRLAAQLVLACAAARYGPRISELAFAHWRWELGQPLSVVATVFWYVAFVNFFNFMDGIDGIAAGTAAVAAVFFWTLARAPAAAVVLGAVVGFLAWNWQPAKVFMGDGGSYLLGFLLAALGVASASPQRPFLICIAVFGVFLADASLTLVRRCLRNESFWKAHRSHYYQRLTDLGYAHAHVTIVYIALAVALGLTGLLSLRSAVELQIAMFAGWLVSLGWLASRIDRKSLRAPNKTYDPLGNAEPEAISRSDEGAMPQRIVTEERRRN